MKQQFNDIYINKIILSLENEISFPVKSADNLEYVTYEENVTPISLSKSVINHVFNRYDVDGLIYSNVFIDDKCFVPGNCKVLEDCDVKKGFKTIELKERFNSFARSLEVASTYICADKASKLLVLSVQIAPLFVNENLENLCIAAVVSKEQEGYKVSEINEMYFKSEYKYAFPKHTELKKGADNESVQFAKLNFSDFNTDSLKSKMDEISSGEHSDFSYFTEIENLSDRYWGVADSFVKFFLSKGDFEKSKILTNDFDRAIIELTIEEVV